MKSLIASVLSLASLGFATAQGQEPKIPKPLDDLASRYAEATAYFEIVETALQNSGAKEDTLRSVSKAKGDSMFYSLLLASEGRTQGIAVQVTNSRIELHKKEMLKEMDHRNENIAVLMNKYGESSIGIVKSPPKELLELLAKKGRRVGEEAQKDKKSKAKS